MTASTTLNMNAESIHSHASQSHFTFGKIYLNWDFSSILILIHIPSEFTANPKKIISHHLGSLLISSTHLASSLVGNAYILSSLRQQKLSKQNFLLFPPHLLSYLHVYLYVLNLHLCKVNPFIYMHFIFLSQGRCSILSFKHKFHSPT